MDWSGWAVFGLMATGVLSTVLVVAQLTGLTRMDLPLMLGTMLVRDPDRARVVGLFLHVVIGQVFALGYAAAFAVRGSSGATFGMGLGLLHGAVALSLLVPALPGVHPRMASERSGPAATSTVLEPPGLFARNYGASTGVVTIAAHVLYGGLLGLWLGPS